MINIAVVEDDAVIQEMILSYIKQYENITGEVFKIAFFEDGSYIVKNYEAKYDLIFMDIQMEHMDGMLTAKKIRELDQEVVIIFITIMGNMAIKGYEVNAIDFMIKPITYQNFCAKFKKAIDLIKKRKKTKYILIPIGKLKKKISTDAIMFIEVKLHTLSVVTKDEVYSIRYTLNKIEEELKGEHFVRCSNAYLVNLSYVTSVEKNDVCVRTYKLPISRMRKKEFMKEFSSYVLGGA